MKQPDSLGRDKDRAFLDYDVPSSSNAVSGGIARKMLAGGVGPIASFSILIFLPFVGRLGLSVEEFAMWAILSTVATASLTLDFGGVVLASSHLRSSSRPTQLLLRASAFSATGSIVIGAVAMAAWIPYSSGATGTIWGTSEGVRAIFLMVLATALRSIVQTLAAGALSLDDYRFRTLAVTSQATLALGVAAVAVFWIHSAWALPIAWLSSSLITLAVALPAFLIRHRSHFAQNESPDQDLRWGSYTAVRTVVILMLSTLTQADRWIIGAIGGPAALVNYELAWRVASIPRLLAFNFSAALVAQVGTAHFQGNFDHIRKMYDQGRVVNRKIIASALIVSVALAPVGAFLATSRTDFLIFASALLLAFVVNALAAPQGAVLLGLSKPSAEIPYLLVALAATGACWAAAAILGNVYIAAVGGAMIFVLASVYFLIDKGGALRNGKYTAARIFEDSTQPAKNLTAQQ